MEFDVPPARRPFAGTVEVPASKSLLQRALILAALSDEPPQLTYAGPAPGEDVRRTAAALQSLGRWQDGALGHGQSVRCDMHFGATGFRCLTAVASLRPPGARTLITGRGELLARPHRGIRRALHGLGARVKRRQSGAHRVVARPLSQGATIRVDGTGSSQFATALALIAPRAGGMTLRLEGATLVSQPYLRLTASMLEQFGIPTALDLAQRTIRVAQGVPTCPGPLAIEADASAAAAWYAAAALVGGEQTVVGLPATSIQADTRIWGLLEAMGATVDRQADLGVRVIGSGDRLTALGEVDLRDATDLVPLVAALAATADGDTTIVGAGHTRRKESDRLARLAAGIQAMGGHARLDETDRLHIRGAALSGATLDVADDHRLAFAFGVLGLRIPGVRLRGAQSTAKSDPQFLAGLSQFVTAG